MPRRVAVTGTRGKSGVTRLIAAGLRASGARVLAKTTGSRPVVIRPDGSEQDIDRPGPASIREQIRLLSWAASSGADTLVSEMMSIGAECLATESRRILRPQILAVTNVRLDHLDEMGRDRTAIARTLAAAVPDRAAIFLPEEELDPAFVKAAGRRGATLHPVARVARSGEPDRDADLPPGEFEPNRRLARAVLRSLGLDDETISRGFASARPDPGSLRIRRGSFGRPPRPAVCLSLFAANDPGSSADALVRALAAVPRGAGRPLVGLVSLREDRGDRTLQWVEAADRGFFRGFAAVYLAGRPARAALRAIRRRRPGPGPVFALASAGPPEDVMGAILASVAPEPVVVGLGNYVGLGEAIAQYWDARGTAHDA